MFGCPVVLDGMPVIVEVENTVLWGFLIVVVCTTCEIEVVWKVLVEDGLGAAIVNAGARVAIDCGMGICEENKVVRRDWERGFCDFLYETVREALAPSLVLVIPYGSVVVLVMTISVVVSRGVPAAPPSIVGSD